MDVRTDMRIEVRSVELHELTVMSASEFSSCQESRHLRLNYRPSPRRLVASIFKATNYSRSKNLSCNSLDLFTETNSMRSTVSIGFVAPLLGDAVPGIGISASRLGQRVTRKISVTFGSSIHGLFAVQLSRG